MALCTGLDHLIAGGFAPVRGRRLAVVCNQASVDRDFVHILGRLESAEQVSVSAVFGPQHGLFGHTQDNMIEWEPGPTARPYRLYSLYGEHREPTDAMLHGIEKIVIDLPDVGARYYTFIWTMSLCMKAATRLKIPVLVLDRPNPIGGVRREGTVQDPSFLSFVGLHPLPMRHGMTIGEIARHLRARVYPDCDLDVIDLSGWDRASYADTNGYAWAMPSPNMPTVDTAVVYPGGCLIEATNLSEGRGTTRPFEMIGAPWLSAERFAAELNAAGLPGVQFRPVEFEPAFNKYAQEVCGGVFVHVRDRDQFEPVLTYLAIIQAAIRQSGLHDSSHVKLKRFQASSAETQLPGFAWKQPPYEYEFEKLPIDILCGNSWMREGLENEVSLTKLRAKMSAECASFEPG